MLVVQSVEEKGTAARLGLRCGDRIVEVNGSPVRDELDFQFHASDESVSLKILRGKRPRVLKTRRRFGEPWGVRFAPTRYRRCGNKCVFCFVDQNPPGLRPSLYFKDEDYRLSFLHGNYVTLTNVGPRDLDRIIEQRLSPLYVSVHATDPQVRRKLLGLEANDRLLEKIAVLTAAGIEIHAQIVLVPDYNDGPVLEATLDDLWRFRPGIASVAVVPVGLTKHRRHLPPLRPVDAGMAAEVVARMEERAEICRRQAGKYWIYLADEFYLKADVPLPGLGRYDDFPQIENGVGMVRAFLDRIENERPAYPKRVGREVRVLILTGRLVAPIFRRAILPLLSRVGGLDVQLRPVRNSFFGDSVTVSGLLVGADLAGAVRACKQRFDLVLTTADVLNADGLLLDDWSVADLEREAATRVLTLRDSFLPLWEAIEAQ